MRKKPKPLPEPIKFKKCKKCNRAIRKKKKCYHIFVVEGAPKKLLLCDRDSMIGADDKIVKRRYNSKNPQYCRGCDKELSDKNKSGFCRSCVNKKFLL